MEWITRLQGKIVAIDSAPLIYFIEEHPDYLPMVRPFFEFVEAGGCSCVASVLALTEVLVQPLRLRRMDVAAKYREILQGSSRIRLVPVSADIAEESASVRALLNLRTPDAIHLASALRSNAVALITNDASIKSHPNLEIINLDEHRIGR